MSTRIAAGMAVAALALPAAASAAPNPVKDVRSNVASARQALDRATSLVGTDPAAASLELARNRAATFRATRAAKRVRGVAGPRSVAGLEDQNIDQYLQMLPLAQGGLQEAVALAIRNAFEARGKALAQLGALAESLPEPARSTIAKVIAAIAAGNPAEVSAVTAELPSVTPQVQGILQQALDLVGQSIKLVTDQILPLLPAVAQGPVQSALKLVTDLLGNLGGLVPGLGGLAGGR